MAMGYFTFRSNLMPVKSGYLSLHNGGTGPNFEITTGTGVNARQYVTFNTAVSQQQTVSDRAVAFPLPQFVRPAGTVAVSGAFAAGSGTRTTTITTDSVLAISGTLYAPLQPYALDNNGDPLTFGNLYPTTYGVRLGLWDAQSGGTYRENVQFTNTVTPFTVAATSGTIQIAAAGLAVTAG